MLRTTQSSKRRETIRRFIRNDEAVAAIEFCLLMPLFAVLYVGTISIFDAYRSYEGLEATTNTVSTMISKFVVIGNNELNEQHRLLAGLSDVAQNNATLEVQSVERVQVAGQATPDTSDDVYEHHVMWSYDSASRSSTGYQGLYTGARTIPILSPGETVLIVETGITDTLVLASSFVAARQNFSNFAVLTPRLTNAIVNRDS